MKKILILSVCVLFCAGTSYGQAGYIGLYSDVGGTDCTMADVSGLCYVYVIHKNAPGATSSKFMIQDIGLNSTIFLNEVFSTGRIWVGSFHSGVVVSYGACYSSDVSLGTMEYFCQGTANPCATTRVVPDPAAPSGTIEVMDCASPPNTLVGNASILTWNDTGSCNPGYKLGPDQNVVSVESLTGESRTDRLPSRSTDSGAEQPRLAQSVSSPRISPEQ
jgi:hypothetical protein